MSSKYVLSLTAQLIAGSYYMYKDGLEPKQRIPRGSIGVTQHCVNWCILRAWWSVVPMYSQYGHTQFSSTLLLRTVQHFDYKTRFVMHIVLSFFVHLSGSLSDQVVGGKRRRHAEFLASIVTLPKISVEHLHHSRRVSHLFKTPSGKPRSPRTSGGIRHSFVSYCSCLPFH